MEQVCALCSQRSGAGELPWPGVRDEAGSLGAFAAVERKCRENQNLRGPRRAFECGGFTAGEVVIYSAFRTRRILHARMDAGRMKMLTRQILAIAAPTVVRSVRRWIFHLGGLGFIPLGLLDSSVIPLPGSMDVLTIVLSAGNQGLWLYYALMATVGSVIGGFVTYRLARKGGKETLERKFPARRLEKVYRIFRRWGFGAIAIAALLPPPAPMVPFLFAAGAMQYSVKKFLFALTLGRIIRYSLLAFLAARYGRQMLTVISQHGHPVLIAVIGLITAVMAALIFILVSKRKKRAHS